MEQVLVLNGLRGDVDTRGTASSCAQAPDGSVTCLDTPLGTAAARAAEIGGEQGAYAASRLDALAQTARDESTQATQRADDLAAASESAHRIGDHGSADVAARAAAAARIQARAALAQSAAAAAAAQAVRIGDARRALMAADAVVAAAWRSELAEVNAGALMGLGLGAVGGDAAGAPLTLKQGLPKDISDVAKFSIADTRTARGQLVGTKLVAFGIKPGTTRLETVSPTGVRKTYTVKVESLLPVEQVQAAQEIFQKIKALSGAPGLDIDWQDANVLRASYDLIYPTLRSVYQNALREAAGRDVYRPQRYGALFLMRVLVHAKTRPDLLTLRDVVMSLPKYTDSGTTVTAPTGPVGGWSTSGRECRRNSETGVVFHDLYVFARDREALFDFVRVVVDVATFVAQLWEGADDSGSTAVSDSLKAVSAAAAKVLPDFANSPKKLISGFGNAVCVAIAGGPSALPAAIRAADVLRRRAVTKGLQFKIAAANALRAPDEEDRRSSAARALALKAEVQQTLVDLNQLDVPAAFTAAERAQLEDVKAAVNVDASLTPSGGGGGGGGGGGTSAPAGAGAAPVLVVGAAAVAFALWRFLR